MELATNTFNKGLLLDTHPMVQGNDSLTDCLNGTLITGNGNEIILQNDMGNRRVDLAFLPAGYEPIGMKEYGGIIYVVAYNPITNKSQIGSFPSPLRNYNNVRKELSILLSYDNNGFRREDRPSGLYGQTYYLINDSYLKILIDKPLIPGDKFLTTFDQWDNKITFLDENNPKICEDPKRLYSIYYGILNSQNLFVDISNSLKRWTINLNNGNETISRYHFLANSNKKPSGEDWINSVTESTQAFEESRLSYDMNTYSGKLVGYPYIKVLINHPVNFTYSYTGFRINDTTVLLNITGKLDYNCPLGTLNSNNKDRYGFSLCYNKHSENHNYLAYCESPIKTEIILNPLKDETTDLYSIVILKEYLFDDIDYLNAQLAVPVQIEDPDNTYLRDLSVPINLDFSLFGSNKLILTSWGFKKDGGDIILRYNINNYFSDIITYSDLTLTLTNITTPSNPINIPLNGIGGTIKITGLTDRHVYTAKISHKIKDLDGNYVQEGGSDKIGYVENTFEAVNTSLETVVDGETVTTISISYKDRLWILNTHLFDECYSSGDKYIINYCKRTDDELKIFNKLTTINTVIDGDLSFTESYSSTLPTGIIDNEFHVTNCLRSYYPVTNVLDDNHISFNIKNLKEYTAVFSDLSINIDGNVQDYPLNLENSFNSKDNSFSLEKDSFTDKVNDIDFYLGNNNSIPLSTPYINNPVYEVETEVNQNNDNKIKITYYDFFDGYAEAKQVSNVEYVFHKLDRDIINDIPFTNNGAMEMRIPKGNVNTSDFSTDSVSMALNTGNSGDNPYMMIDYFSTSNTTGTTNYFFQTGGMNHPYDNYPMAGCDSTYPNSNSNIFNQVFMYRDNEEDIFGKYRDSSDNHFTTVYNTYAPVKYCDNINGNNTNGLDSVETRSIYSKKFIIFAKTYDENIDINGLKYDVHSMEGNTEYGNIRWGIIKGMVDCSTQIDNSRELVISKIFNLFPSNSRICTKRKENIKVYTINDTINKSNTYCSQIDSKCNLEKDITVSGEKNDVTNNNTLEIPYISTDNVNTSFKFIINCKSNKTFKKKFYLSSNSDYLNKLNEPNPRLDKYLDYSTGEIIDVLVPKGNIYNYVYVYNNNEFKIVNNVLMIYNRDETELRPIFCRNKTDDSYHYVISELPVVGSSTPDKYVFNFRLWYWGNLDYRIFPIKNLEVLS